MVRRGFQRFRGKSRNRREQTSRSDKGCTLLPTAEPRRIWASPFSGRFLFAVIRELHPSRSIPKGLTWRCSYEHSLGFGSGSAASSVNK